MRCNGEGTAEVGEDCALGCNASELRCNEITPSNGLRAYLEVAADEPELDLGELATIDTSNGAVTVDGRPVMVRSALLAQPDGPTILVFIVRSLTSGDVTISGSNAFALVSHDEVRIGGVFSASAKELSAPGRFSDAACQGGPATIEGTGRYSGTGGGGFGEPGARGGSATNRFGSTTGGAAGTAAGNATLIPLRGGCDSGWYGNTEVKGAGGGAIQLVSRSKIGISGVVAANGSSFVGGGSGGGILLEAPSVEVTGSVVANGGAGAGGCVFPRPGEDGRLDATPARGAEPCNSLGARGGNGGSGGVAPQAGGNLSSSESDVVLAGHGGGGVGRIRINTAPGGFTRAGLFSPDPSTGTITIR